MFSLCCAAVGVSPDADGLPLLWGGAGAFMKYHHTFGHSLLTGVPIAVLAAAAFRRWGTRCDAVLAAFLRRWGYESPRPAVVSAPLPVLVFWLYLSWVSHLAGDWIGTDWPIAPFWPLEGPLWWTIWSSDWTAARWLPHWFIYDVVNPLAALLFIPAAVWRTILSLRPADRACPSSGAG